MPHSVFDRCEASCMALCTTVLLMASIVIFWLLHLIDTLTYLLTFEVFVNKYLWQFYGGGIKQ